MSAKVIDELQGYSIQEIIYFWAENLAFAISCVNGQDERDSVYGHAVRMMSDMLSDLQDGEDCGDPECEAHDRTGDSEEEENQGPDAPSVN